LGKEVLPKLVVQSVSTYTISVFLLPISIFDKMEIKDDEYMLIGSC